MARQAFNTLCDSIKLDASYVNSIFFSGNSEKGQSLKQTEIISKKAGDKLSCPLNQLSVNQNKTSTLIYFQCIINKNVRYSVKFMKCEIQKDHELTLEVKKNSEEKCEHGVIKEQRQLRGSAREKIKQQLAKKTSQEIQNEAISSADLKLAQRGNLQEVHSLAVFDKVRSEALAIKDRDKDPLQDILSEAREERKTNETVFIQKIDALPFSLHMFFDSVLDLLHGLKLKRIQLYLDATGSLCQKLNTTSLLHHVIVLPVKTHENNKKHLLLNIAELVTEDNSSFNIAHFLRHITQKYFNRYKTDSVRFDFVTDKSFANINAIISSQNNITLSAYLVKTYEICNKNLTIDDISLVLLCSSHLSKNWRSDVKNCFNKLEKSKQKFICSLIGNLMNIQEYQKLVKYINLLMRFFCQRDESAEFNHISQELKKMVVENDGVENESENENDENDEDIVEDYEQPSANVIYKSSPFFVEFNNVFETIRHESDNGAINNQYYSIKFVEGLLKKTLAFLPLWSAVLPSHALEDKSKFKRANNGFVESYFGHLKNGIRNDKAIERIGNVRVGRYVRYIRNKNELDMKKIFLNIPETHATRQPRRSRTSENTLSTSQEQWKGKSDARSSIMFNRNNLTKGLDSLSMDK